MAWRARRDEVEEVREAASVFRSAPRYETPSDVAADLRDLLESGAFPTLTG